MKKLIPLILSWFLLLTTLWAEPPPSPKGVLILTPASGLDARNVLFSDLVWADFSSGTVVGIDGQKSVFINKAIGKIVYFDSNYYGQLDDDPQMKAFRAGLQNREIVVNTSFFNLRASNDLKSLQDGESTLESVAHDYPAVQLLIQPQIDHLKDDISKLSSGQSLLDGKWMNQQDAAKQSAVPVVGEVNKPVTFTTKDGRKYVDAKVTLTDTGLSVLTPDGGASVAFDQLPDDLSMFTDSIRKQIADKHQAAMVPIENPQYQAQPLSPTAGPSAVRDALMPASESTNNSACARVGEKEDVIIARRLSSNDEYRISKQLPISLSSDYLWNHLNGTVKCDVIDFTYSSFKVRVNCLNGVSESEYISGLIPPEGVKLLLNANSQGHTWTKMKLIYGKNIWVPDDFTDTSIAYSKLYGTYLRDDGAQATISGNSFSIITNVFINSLKAAEVSGHITELQNWASLGDNRDQLIQCYGKALQESDLPAYASHGVALHFMQFSKSGVTIFAYLLNGKTVSQEISKQNNSSMSDQDRQKILDANMEGHAWREVPPPVGASRERRWQRDDGDLAIATFGGMELNAKTYDDAKEAAAQAALHPKMKGF
jgi:hypothetical protein